MRGRRVSWRSAGPLRCLARDVAGVQARVAALEAPSGGGSGSWCHGDAHALEVAEGLARGLEAVESLESMLEQLGDGSSWHD